MESRKNCRNAHKILRESMSSSEVQEKSRQINEYLLAADWYNESEVIYGYYPLGNEVDCRPFLEQALKDGKTVCLPRTGKDYSMEFYKIQSLSDVNEGNFHVMEPKKECELVQSKTAVVFVPGVVFDRKGNRYGYGKGFYDRYFSRFLELEKYALCYEHQMEDELEVLVTDVKMNRIYTEKGEQKWNY